VAAPTLQGDRVRLRPVADADIPALVAILEEPAVAEWWRRAEWERVDEPSAHSFAVELDGAVVGCI
jgi:hypothetical protein